MKRKVLLEFLESLLSLDFIFTSAVYTLYVFCHTVVPHCISAASEEVSGFLKLEYHAYCRIFFD